MASAAKVIDFSNVKEGGNFNKARIPAGEYLATIVKVEDAESKSDKVFQYLFSIKIDKRPGTVLPYYCKLQENQLWKLRNILIAAGKSVPKKKAKVDPNSIVGKKIGVTIEDTDYEGKEQSEIAGLYPAAELSDDVDSDDEPAEDEDAEDAEEEAEEEEAADDEAEEADDEEEAEEDPYADMDRTALKAALKELDASFQAKKSQTDDDLRDLLRAAAGDTATDDDEEEEEEPAPAPKASTRKKPAAKKAADVSDEELEELDIDDL